MGLEVVQYEHTYCPEHEHEHHHHEGLDEFLLLLFLTFVSAAHFTSLYCLTRPLIHIDNILFVVSNEAFQADSNIGPNFAKSCESPPGHSWHSPSA